MRRLVWFLIALLTVVLIQSISAAQSSGPKTVLDYYLLLPEKYFEASKEQRIKWMLDGGRGAIVDIKNGYIYAPGDGAQTSIYVSLFKRPQSSSLIAVKSHPPDTDEFTHLDFYEYKDGALVEVKTGVIPVKINQELKYVMPRYGKSIVVCNRRGKRIYTLVWSGRRFVLHTSWSYYRVGYEYETFDQFPRVRLKWLPVSTALRLKLTLKAFANFSPRLERQRQPWVTFLRINKPWKGYAVGEPFQGLFDFSLHIPGFSLARTLGSN